MTSRDTGWAVAPGESRPIREVLRSISREHNAQPKAQREAAFRERAGMQALLVSCLCCHPIEDYPTASQHADWCPAHGMWVSMQAAGDGP